MKHFLSQAQRGAGSLWLIGLLMVALVLTAVALTRNTNPASLATAPVNNPTVAFMENGSAVTSLSVSASNTFQIVGSGWGKNACILIYVSTSPVSGGQGARADNNGNFSSDLPTWLLNTSGQPGGTPATSATFTFKKQSTGGWCTKYNDYATVLTQTMSVTP